ncbi:MAG: ABC transporter permease subunit [Clostridia bacterium]|nr:ABC transporter permease subunit [Clostridia bacterium]
MTTSTTNHNLKLKSALKKLLVIAFWIGLWQVVYMIVQQEILIVSPARVVIRIFELVQQQDFWHATLLSLFRIMQGYLLAVVFGVILAVLTTKISFLYDLFYPVMSLVKATPVASFIIIALVWIGRDNVPTFISFLMVLPIVWSNVSAGINGVDKGLLEVAKVFGFSKSKTITKVYVPSVSPMFLSACTTGLGFAWKAGISAEVISVPTFSIGTQLYNAKIYIETQDLFAWTLVVVALSVIIEKLVVTLINKLGGRRGVPNDKT